MPKNRKVDGSGRGMEKCQFMIAFSFEKSIIRDLETEA